MKLNINSRKLLKIFDTYDIENMGKYKNGTEIQKVCNINLFYFHGHPDRIQLEVVSRDFAS